PPGANRTGRGGWPGSRLFREGEAVEGLVADLRQGGAHFAGRAPAAEVAGALDGQAEFDAFTQDLEQHAGAAEILDAVLGVEVEVAGIRENVAAPLRAERLDTVDGLRYRDRQLRAQAEQAQR